MTRVAVVGVGDWGRNLLRVFDAEATVDLCCHRGDPDTAAWLDEHYPDTPVTTDYAAVLDSDVDAVVVATPIDTHGRLVRDALAADKHVYVEKPLGPTGEVAAAAAALADERDLCLFVGYLFVHHPLFDRVADVVADAGARSLHLEWSYVGGFETSLVTDYACHPVSVTTALFGGGGGAAAGDDRAPAQPDTVEVTACDGAENDLDRLSATLTYGDVDCHIDVSRVAPREHATRISLLTETGDWYVWDDTDLRRLDRDRGTFETLATADAEPLAAECRTFLAGLDDADTDPGPVTDGSFAVAVHDVLDSIRSEC